MQTNPDKIFFTSDTHFSHKNIIEYSNRPFDSVAEMDDVLINNWNKTVPTDGLVYHLGDMFFSMSDSRAGEIIHSLNGQIIQLKGNHDKQAEKIASKHPESKYKFLRNPYYEISVHGQFIVLCHYPIISWHKANRGSYHLHGHCHANLDYNEHKLYGPLIDVGVDNCQVTLKSKHPENYRPLSYEEIDILLKHKEFKIKDHHGDR